MLFWNCYTGAAPSCNTNAGDCEDEALEQQGNVNIEPRFARDEQTATGNSNPLLCSRG